MLRTGYMISANGLDLHLIIPVPGIQSCCSVIQPFRFLRALQKDRPVSWKFLQLQSNSLLTIAKKRPS